MLECGEENAEATQRDVAIDIPGGIGQSPAWRDCLTGSDLGLGTGGTWPDLVTVMPCTQRHTAEVFFAENAWPQSMAYSGNNVSLAAGLPL
jgi:hypothetical protein